MADRKTVAQELATKDGHDWEKLSPEMVNAYLHNADGAIEDRGRPPVDEIDPKPVYTCPMCQDMAYIGGRRCLECNPMGLPVEQVHPAKLTLANIDAAIATLKKEGKDPGYTDEEKADLKETVTLEYQPLDAYVEKEEAEFTEKKAEEVKRTRELKPSEYRCSKCSKPGKTVIHMLKKGGKGIGHKHQEFAVKVN